MQPYTGDHGHGQCLPLKWQQKGWTTSEGSAGEVTEWSQTLFKNIFN